MQQKRQKSNIFVKPRLFEKKTFMNILLRNCTYFKDSLEIDYDVGTVNGNDLEMLDLVNYVNLLPGLIQLDLYTIVRNHLDGKGNFSFYYEDAFLESVEFTYRKRLVTDVVTDDNPFHFKIEWDSLAVDRIIKKVLNSHKENKVTTAFTLLVVIELNSDLLSKKFINIPVMSYDLDSKSYVNYTFDSLGSGYYF